MPSSDWLPVVDAVGAILRARTKDRSNNELGTFTPATRPTDAQVTEMIAQASSDVVDVVGADLPPATWESARYVASLGAALQIELSYFPEQVGTGRSPYAQLKVLYDERLRRLVSAVEAAGGTAVGEGSTSLTAPAYDFPMLGDPYILGRRTAW